MALESEVKSQVESYQRLKKLMLLNTQYYKVRIKSKMVQSMEKLTPQCSCYWIGSLRATLDFTFYKYIYIRTVFHFLIDKNYMSDGVPFWDDLVTYGQKKGVGSYCLIINFALFIHPPHRYSMSFFTVGNKTRAFFKIWRGIMSLCLASLFIEFEYWILL